jgi:creatinine amidohydrolase/Fe(II)-dependent formamide hydrolase-like protein
MAVVLPLAGLSPDGKHLAMGTAAFLLEALIRPIATEEDRLLLLPSLAFAPLSGLGTFPGVVRISLETFVGQLRELSHDFVREEFGRLVLLGLTPGGPDVLAAAGEVRRRHPNLSVATLDAGVVPGGRAMTSLALHLAPQMVRAPFGGDAVLHTEPEWRTLRDELTMTGALEDPSGASAEEGATLADQIRRRWRDRLKTLSGPVTFRAAP